MIALSQLVCQLVRKCKKEVKDDTVILLSKENGSHYIFPCQFEVRINSSILTAKVTQKRQIWGLFGFAVGTFHLSLKRV